MTNANYMQMLDEGHCLTCHKDYKTSEGMHPCFLKPSATPCGEACGRWFDGNKYKTFTKAEVDLLLSQQKEKLVDEIKDLFRRVEEREDRVEVDDVLKLLK